MTDETNRLPTPTLDEIATKLTPLVERLRSCAVRVGAWSGPDILLREAANEIERLRTALVKADDTALELERRWREATSENNMLRDANAKGERVCTACHTAHYSDGAGEEACP